MRAGAAIYLRGELPDGMPLVGTRADGPGLGVRGRDAACVNCHQRSGLGALEGNVVVPPIAGRYLFAGPGAGTADLPYTPTARLNRRAYTETSFLRALREGKDADDRSLGVLMPRFRIDAAATKDLIAYLDTLEPEHVPGVDPSVLHFATIITPDADPDQARAMLGVLRHFFAQKNDFPLSPSPRARFGGLGYYTKNMYRTNRRWQLHVWSLHGAAGTWGAQLDADLAREPVMAVISGLGRNVWQPVHDFCERRKVPCLFPNVDVPVAARGDFYSLYLSDGVLLEAGLIADAIAAHHDVHRVLEIYRRGDSGEQASAAAERRLRRRDPEARVERLGLEPSADLAAALAHAPPADAWILWLRSADLARLGSPVRAPSRVFVSGLLGGLERAPLPESWRSRVRLAYPVDLPEDRRVRLDFPLGWFRFQRIPVVAERVQVNTYLACGILSETLADLSDNLQRDYLVEVLEGMLEHRFLTGYYPRLTLAPGESFASRGGYIVRFVGDQGSRVVADDRWTVP
ncbi:MAG: cytochrome C [Gammaproteobacteria bacterium]|nr:cytochrome C [Gammaproteobacteria bacterium]